MADDKNNAPAEAEDPKAPERRAEAPKEGVRFDWDKEKNTERREISRDDKIVSDELKREIELLEADETTSAEAKRKADKIEFLGEKEKIEHLLEIAREKGVVFAIQVAKKMNEPYLLDILHDTLAREGFYLKMGKPTDDDNKT